MGNPNHQKDCISQRLRGEKREREREKKKKKRRRRTTQIQAKQKMRDVVIEFAWVKSRDIKTNTPSPNPNAKHRADREAKKVSGESHHRNPPWKDKNCQYAKQKTDTPKAKGLSSPLNRLFKRTHQAKKNQTTQLTTLQFQTS